MRRAHPLSAPELVQLGAEVVAEVERDFKNRYWNLCMVQDKDFRWSIRWEESPALLDMDLCPEVRAEARLRRVSSVSLVRELEVDGVHYEASARLPSSGRDLLWEVLLSEEEDR